MAKITLNEITSGYGAKDALNDNFAAIETAMENTLSRDGTSPNQMDANLDMNGYNFLNVGKVNGVDVTYLGSLDEFVEKTSNTGSAKIPVGTTAQRDEEPINGYFRYNSSNNTFEGYVTNTWYQFLTAGGNITWYGAQRSYITTDNDLSFDLDVGNNFKCTVSGAGTLTFTNINNALGQSGYIIIANPTGYAIAADSSVKAATTLVTTISNVGTYLVSYLCDGSSVYCTTSGALS